MKRFLSPAVFAALSLAATGDELKSTVRFSNKDVLSGSLESLATEYLVWNSPILEKPTPFFLKNVVDLTLNPEEPEIKAGHEAAVTLTKGDLLRGQLVSVTDEGIELDTWYAGRLKISRPVIADIKISERPDFIYHGPTGLDGWKQSGAKPAWTYQNLGFRSTGVGSIARNVNLPYECSISFDAAWRGAFALELAFFSGNQPSDRSTTGYAMNFRQRNISVRSCKTQRTLGNTINVASLQENEKAHIEVRASLKSGKICILLDGVLVDVWTDPDIARNEMGRGIQFISPGASPVQVSRIEVAAWDGEVGQVPDPQIVPGIQLGGMPGGMPGGDDADDPEEPAAPEDKPKAGRMELRNGDNIEGEVVAINDGRITVKTPFREVKLPIEALRSIALKPADRDESKRENGDVRGWFADGSWVVFRLEAVENGMLTGYSHNFGTARFKLSAFSRIEFNIYDSDLDDIRAAGDW
jgi:hypothetical protein